MTTLGNPSHADADWERILNTGSKQGRTALPGSHSDNLLYTVQSSDQFSYSVISLCPAKIYTVDQLHELILLSLGLIFVFTLITILYVRQFSNDSLFIQSILHSLIEAQSSNFVPVKIGPRKDEFANHRHPPKQPIPISGHVNPAKIQINHPATAHGNANAQHAAQSPFSL